jgi:hypothetical protein
MLSAISGKDTQGGRSLLPCEACAKMTDLGRGSVGRRRPNRALTGACFGVGANVPQTSAS